MAVSVGQPIHNILPTPRWSAGTAVWALSLGGSCMWQQSASLRHTWTRSHGQGFIFNPKRRGRVFFAVLFFAHEGIQIWYVVFRPQTERGSCCPAAAHDIFITLSSLSPSSYSRIRMTHAATERSEILLRLADTCSNYLHSARCHLSLVFLHSVTSKSIYHGLVFAPLMKTVEGERGRRRKKYIVSPQLNFQACT